MAKEYKISSDFNDEKFVDSLRDFVQNNYGTNISVSLLGSIENAILKIKGKGAFMDFLLLSRSVTLQTSVEGDTLTVRTLGSEMGVKIGIVAASLVLVVPTLGFPFVVTLIGLFRYLGFRQNVFNFISIYMNDQNRQKQVS